MQFYKWCNVSACIQFYTFYLFNVVWCCASVLSSKFFFPNYFQIRFSTKHKSICFLYSGSLKRIFCSTREYILIHIRSLSHLGEYVHAHVQTLIQTKYAGCKFKLIIQLHLNDEIWWNLSFKNYAICKATFKCWVDTIWNNKLSSMYEHRI